MAGGVLLVMMTRLPSMNPLLLCRRPVMTEAEIRPVPRLLLLGEGALPRRRANLDHSRDLAMRSVESEDIVKVKILRREIVVVEILFGGGDDGVLGGGDGGVEVSGCVGVWDELD